MLSSNRWFRMCCGFFNPRLCISVSSFQLAYSPTLWVWNVRNSVAVKQRIEFLCLHNRQRDFTKKQNKIKRSTLPSGPKLIGEADTKNLICWNGRHKDLPFSLIDEEIIFSWYDIRVVWFLNMSYGINC